MEITFQNRTADFEAFYEYALKYTQEGKLPGKQVLIRRQFYLVLIIALISALAWGILSNLGVRLVNSLLTSVLFFVCMLVSVEAILLLVTGFKPSYYFGRRILEHRASLSTKKDLALFQSPKTITIDNDWLEVRTSDVLHRWRWKLVDEIRLMSDFIFLRVDRCDVYQIPKRDFPSELDFAQFGNRLIQLQTERKEQSVFAGPKS